MEYERRRAERVTVNLDIQWESDKGWRKGTISDVSVNGCFVLCDGDVNDGELIKIEIALTRKSISLWGAVANHSEDIGFGMRFTNNGAKETAFLERLIRRAKSKARAET